MKTQTTNKTVLKNAETFTGKVYAVHGDRFDFASVLFSGLSKNITVPCSHGSFEVKASDFIKGKITCDDCNSEPSIQVKPTEQLSFTEKILASTFYQGYIKKIEYNFGFSEELSISIFKIILLGEEQPLNVAIMRIAKLFRVDEDQDESRQKEALFVKVGKLLNRMENFSIVTIDNAPYHSIDDETLLPVTINRYTLTSVAKLTDDMVLEKFKAPTFKPHEDYDTDNNMSGNRHAIMGDEHNKHADQQRLDVLNILQNIPFKLHEISNNFVPECPIEEDNAKRIKKVNAWKIFNRTFGLTKQAIDDRNFYHAWQLDKRGRSYSVAYALNPQGAEFQKAMTELGNTEYLNVDESTICDTSRQVKFEDFSPMDILLVSFANHYGLDKENWNTRIDWSVSHLETFKSGNYKEILRTAEEPILLEKAILSYRQALRGEKIGLQVYFDATASFAQIASVLMGNEKEVLISNVIANPMNKRMDPYTEIAKDFKSDWFINEPSNMRKAVKKPIMTANYNSKRVPAATFKPASLPKFYEIMEKELPASTKLRKVINRCYGKGRSSHEFTLPDGHIAYMPSLVKVEKSVFIEAINDELDFSMSTVAANTLNRNSLSPNYTHSIDAWIVAEMVRMANKQGFDLYAIHDSFSCHPNHAVQMMKNYRVILAKLYMLSPLEENVLKLSDGKVEYITSFRDNYTENCILNSQYAIC